MNLSLKAKGLLSMMLSLPDSWNYTTRGLAAICKEGVDAIGSAVRELEKAGYIVRRLLRGEGGRIADTEYVIYEQPQGGPDTLPPVPPAPDTPSPPSGGPDMASPHPGNPYAAGPDAAAPCAGKPVQLNTDPVSTDRSNTHLSRPTEGNARGGAPGEAAGCSEQAVRFERERIRAQIEYDRIINVENREQVDEFVEIMLAASSPRAPPSASGGSGSTPPPWCGSGSGKSTAPTSSACWTPSWRTRSRCATRKPTFWRRCSTPRPPRTTTTPWRRQAADEGGKP